MTNNAKSLFSKYSRIAVITTVIGSFLCMLLYVSYSSKQNIIKPLYRDIRTAVKMYKDTNTPGIGNIFSVPDNLDSRTERLKLVHDFIYNKLDENQNGGDCEKKKLLKCSMKSVPGFGAYHHKLVICMYTAFALGRAIFFYQPGFNARGFKGIADFTSLETGKCGYLRNNLSNIEDRCDFNDPECYLTDYNIAINETYKLLVYSDEFFFPQPRYIAGTLPKRIGLILENLQIKTPWYWFFSQLMGYMIFTPNNYMQDKFSKLVAKIGIRRPIIGMHIRRGDRIPSRPMPSLRQYLDKADEWFNNRKEKRTKRYVYITSDDPYVPGNFSKLAGGRYIVKSSGLHQVDDNYHRNDLSKLTMENILLELYILAHCDYSIVAFLSNIGRLVYEMKTSKFPYNASDTVFSLDHHNKILVETGLTPTVTFYVTIRNNENEYPLKGKRGLNKIIKYDKGLLSSYYLGSEILTFQNGTKVKVRRIKVILDKKGRNIAGYALDRDLTEWPGDVHYKSDMI